MERSERAAGAAATPGERERRSDAGTNQAGSRAYNERLVLALIRRDGAMPKAELARRTGLSAQTLTLIVNRLEHDGLVLPGQRLRGRVGQPSVPYALNADAAFSFGVKIGRRSVELALTDFLGRIRRRARADYDFPVPGQVLDFTRKELRRLGRSLRGEMRGRLLGAGVAMPFRLWDWGEDIEGAAADLACWQDVDVTVALAEALGTPVLLAKDATAACGAELWLGRRREVADYAYFFVGWFIGGGIVLNGSLYPGRSGNAGALGSLPVWASRSSVQLLRRASLAQLEQRLRARGLDPLLLADADHDWMALGRCVHEWIDEAGAAIAEAVAAATAVLDLPCVVIDGALPDPVRDALVAAVRDSYSRLDTRGLSPLEIAPGSVGRDARLLGAATLPMLASFAPDSEVLFKSAG